MWLEGRMLEVAHEVLVRDLMAALIDKGLFTRRDAAGFVRTHATNLAGIGGHLGVAGASDRLADAVTMNVLGFEG